MSNRFQTMTKTKILSVFVIVAVAAMMGASSIAPAYAAQKVVNFHEEDEDFISLAPNPCGDGLVAAILVTNTFLKAWDNGKFKLHDDAEIILIAQGPTLVGTIPLNALNIQGDLDDLPISGNFNLGGDGECADGTTFENPIADEFHCGATVQKDGDVVDHAVSCF